MTTRQESSSRVIDREQIVRELVEFLAEPPTIDQPRIIRSPIGQTNRQQVSVLWDRWKGISHQERSSLILQANERLPEEDRIEIGFAVGLTTEEAISLGYFPYKITPPPALPEPEVQARIEQAMRDEGALITNEGLELRFTNIQDAYDTCVRLQEKVAGPFWAITKEEFRES